MVAHHLLFRHPFLLLAFRLTKTAILEVTTVTMDNVMVDTMVTMEVGMVIMEALMANMVATAMATEDPMDQATMDVMENTVVTIMEGHQDHRMNLHRLRPGRPLRLRRRGLPPRLVVGPVVAHSFPVAKILR